MGYGCIQYIQFIHGRWRQSRPKGSAFIGLIPALTWSKVATNDFKVYDQRKPAIWFNKGIFNYQVAVDAN